MREGLVDGEGLAVDASLIRADANRQRGVPGSEGLEAMQARLDRAPKIMRVRRSTVEHPFGTIKSRMGATHFRMKTLEKVRTEMSLHVLVYNLKRVIEILGTGPLMQAMRA
jgi:transposase